MPRWRWCWRRSICLESVCSDFWLLHKKTSLGQEPAVRRPTVLCHRPLWTDSTLSCFWRRLSLPQELREVLALWEVPAFFSLRKIIACEWLLFAISLKTSLFVREFPTIIILSLKNLTSCLPLQKLWATICIINACSLGLPSFLADVQVKHPQHSSPTVRFLRQWGWGNHRRCFLETPMG